MLVIPTFGLGLSVKWEVEKKRIATDLTYDSTAIEKTNCTYLTTSVMIMVQNNAFLIKDLLHN